MVDRVSRPLSLVVACCLGIAATAQEVRLKDGTVLHGKVTKAGNEVRVATLDGTRTLAADQVQKIRTREELSADLRALANRHGDAPHAQLELARMARGYGLHGSMWRHLDDCWNNWQTEGVGRRLATFLADLEPEILPSSARQLAIPKKVRELLKRAHGKRKARVVAIEHVLAGLPDAAKSLRKEARRSGSPLRRLTALRALALRGETGDGRFVLRSAILDSSDSVRRESVRVPISQAERTSAVAYLAPGLVSNNTKVAQRTVAAFENLGDPAAVPFLVQAGPIVAAPAGPLPGGATRAYMAVTEQTSYIRDFDVEVAQASFIADPKVDVVQSGVVLDVTVHGVTTRRINLVKSFRRTLRNLTGSDPGPDPSGWAAWYARQQPVSAPKNQ